jgi:DNA topoisomerase VI subunit B
MEGRPVLPYIKIRAAKTDSNELLNQVIDNGSGVESRTLNESLMLL